MRSTFRPMVEELSDRILPSAALPILPHPETYGYVSPSPGPENLNTPIIPAVLPANASYYLWGGNSSMWGTVQIAGGKVSGSLWYTEPGGSVTLSVSGVVTQALPHGAITQVTLTVTQATGSYASLLHSTVKAEMLLAYRDYAIWDD
jgi:hypothetical protein